MGCDGGAAVVARRSVELGRERETFPGARQLPRPSQRLHEREVITVRLLICSTAALAAAAALAARAAADPAATPVTTGCPAGYSLFAVGTPPYRVPAQLDNPANGGNGDGYVCARAFPDAVRDAFCAAGRGGCLLEQLGLPLYLFGEDNNPAEGANAANLDLGG
jgi:hypothetical protein